MPSNAVNDELSGLVVSDSKPLELSNLMLGQKVDVTLSGKEMSLPILRECLKHGTKIDFTISIDATKTDLTKEDISKSIELFNENYYECFLSAFAGTKKPESNAVYLGGGSGFATKTVIYPLYGKKAGVPLVSTIFKKTMNDKIYKKHVHESDVDLGISPHIAKYTENSSALFEMGLCRLEFI
ncbi:MAG: type III-A CRISPR-associated RAMP protein Csm5 [Clostridiales bacterium]|nr:type III-A CRISPR-associated RAMP protein Csm5 [Clostridiales bacterium]